MKNPWLKKNPLMSMWLSGANRVAGAARGHATAAIKRELTQASNRGAAAATKQVLDIWDEALQVPAKRRPKKRR